MRTTVWASWPWEWGPAQWLAAAPVGAVLVAAAGLVIAQQQLRHARTLKDLQHRPYVIVDLEFRRWLVMLTIRNISATPASDCTLEFDQPLNVPHRKDVATYEIFSNPIPMLAPGRRIQVSLGEGHKFFDAKKDYPLRYEVLVRYASLDGKTLYDHDPPCILDLKPFQNAALEPEGTAEIAKSLREIKTHLTQTIEGRRLRVRVQDDDALARRERRNYHWEMFTRTRRQNGLRAAVQWWFDQKRG